MLVFFFSQGFPQISDGNSIHTYGTVPSKSLDVFSFNNIRAAIEVLKSGKLFKR